MTLTESAKRLWQAVIRQLCGEGTRNRQRPDVQSATKRSAQMITTIRCHWSVGVVLMTLDDIDKGTWSAVLRIRARLNVFRTVTLNLPPVDYTDLNKYPIFDEKETP